MGTENLWEQVGEIRNMKHEKHKSKENIEKVRIQKI